MAAINNFRLTAKRAKRLIKVHKDLCPRGKPKAEYADMLRAVVVISVSAMDGYFHEKIPENVSRLVRARKGRQLPGKLVNVIKETTSHDKLIEILFKDRPTSHLVSAVRKSMNDRSYQDAGRIADALKLLGVDDLWFQLGKHLGVKKEKAKTFVQTYVKRRHQIVHRGDYGETKKTKNRLAPISRKYVVRCVNDIERFIEAIDKIVELQLAKAEKKK